MTRSVPSSFDIVLPARMRESVNTTGAGSVTAVLQRAPSGYRAAAYAYIPK